MTDLSLLEHATLEELERYLELEEWRKIEHAESCAHAKSKAFQAVFFNRADETGRRCSKFVALGGNRSSKSFTCGRMCFAKYLRDVAKPGDLFWVIGQNLDRSVGVQQKEIWDALPSTMFGGRTWEPKNGFGGNRTVLVRSRHGGFSTVEFRSADQDADTFEGAKLRGVWADERLPEAIYNRLLPRLIDLDGFLLYSDIPEQWWQIERLKHAKPEAGVYYRVFTMWDNEANLPKGAIEQAAAGMTREEQQMRIAGEHGIMEGLVYKQYRDFYDNDAKIPGHLVRPFPRGVPDEWPKWRLIDYGASAPTACLWVTIAPNEHVYCYREYYEAGLSVGKNAAAIVVMSGNEKYVKTLMDPHAVDQPPVFYGAAKTIAQQYAEGGIESTGWPFTNVMGEHAMVQRVKFRLENRTLWVGDGLANLRREFQSYKHKLDKDGKPLAADAYENTNNHLLDCLKGFLGTNPTYTRSSGWSFK